MTFKELGLTPALLRAVSELDYVTPSPIQEKAVPPLLEGRDLIGCAQTGTGKTAAFALPLLQQMQNTPARGVFQGKRRPIRALILTPTRELALQIKESFDDYGKYLPMKNTVIFGGVGQNPQVQALRAGVDVLVATPGRLCDLIGQGHVDLAGVEFFVLDEADRMLDMGFIHDVRRILRYLPDKEERQTLLFSATMPNEIENLARQLLRDPVRVAVTPVSSTVDTIEQSLYKVDKNNKPKLLREVLRDTALSSVLVFTRTKHGADRVVRDLERAGVRAMAIHGNKSQTARQNALDSFKTGEIRVLVATDIAARGLDINDLACVINYDLPNIPETYVHRIGRTGRAGRDGIAISFCMYEELPYLADIQKLTKKAIPEITEHPYPMEVFENAPKQQRPPRQQADGNSEHGGRGKQQRGREKPAPRGGSERPDFPPRPRAQKPAKPQSQKKKTQNYPQKGGQPAQPAAGAVHNKQRAVPPEIKATRAASQSRDPQAPTTRKNAQLDESLLHRRPRRGSHK